MKFSQLLLLLSLFAFACGDAQQENAAMEASSDGTAANWDMTTAAAETIDSAGVKVPVFQTFEQLQPLFQQQNGTTYVINFWATWCKPCLEEMPYFEQLHEEYADKNVEVILVSLDFEKDLHTKLLPFLQKRQLKPAVLAFTDSNYNNWIENVSEDWNGAIPATLIYKNDKERLIEGQFANYAELQSAVIEFLQS